MRKIYGLLITVLVVLCFSANSVAQRSGDTTSVSLTRQAKKDGYETEKKGKDFYFEAINVENPRDKLRLQGEREVEYRCKLDEIPYIKKLLFSNGRSNRQKVECLILISPKIIIQE